MIRWMIAASVGLLVGAGSSFGQASNPAPTTRPTTTAPASRPTTQPAAPTDAERISRLKRALEEDRALLKQIQDGLTNPESEFAEAEKEFTQLDKEFEDATKNLANLKEAGQTQEAAAFETELAALQKKRELALQRFNLAVESRKTEQARLTALQDKIRQDEAVLVKLTGAPTTAPATQPSETSPAGPTAQTETSPPSTPPAAPATTPEAPPAAAPANGTAVATQTPATPTTTPPSSTDPATTQPAAPPKPPSAEVVRQQEVVRATEEEAQKAEEEVRSIEERIEQLNTNIELEKRAQADARKQVDIHFDRRRAFEDQRDQEWSKPNPDRKIIDDLFQKIREAGKSEAEARAKARAQVDRVDGLQQDLDTLQKQRISALEELRTAQQKAEEAQKELATLQNPFTLRNMLRWVIEHGPRILAVILGMIVAYVLTRLVSRHIVKFVAAGSSRGSSEERQNRAHTLVGVFQHTASLLIVIGGIVMILDEVGMPITPLLGGAAVAGLAVAFGAQKLIRDYFHGFFILLENQYSINDVVRIGGIAGLVERITLRMTILRDLEGIVHFVPNGDITTVSNMTHGWSRALFQIGVAYKENVDQVMEVLMQLGKELRQDPEFAPLILDDPEMLGLDAMGDSAIVIKFFIKTRPLQQWKVRRQLLRRIKMRFDELGIEIPFPHRTVYHRYEPGAAPAEAMESHTGWR